jgi:parallel beta-helix repeat protein
MRWSEKFGIVLTNGASNNLLVGNEAHANGSDGLSTLSDDGITVDGGSGNRLIGNVATNNGGYGIDVVSGGVDGGGNTAKGNTLGQCVGVACS